MKLKIMSLMVLIVFILVPVSLAATENCTASPWAKEPTYGKKVLKKAEFGASNLLLGWTELFTEPAPAFRAKAGVFNSIFQGFWNALADTGGGALHLVTAPFPGVDLPLPECGADVWGKSS